MCKAVEMMLDKKGIEYDSVMDMDKMVSSGVTCTPTLDVDGKRYIKKECLDWVREQ